MDLFYSETCHSTRRISSALPSAASAASHRRVDHLISPSQSSSGAIRVRHCQRRIQLWDRSLSLYLGRPAGLTTQETFVFLFLSRNQIPREQTHFRELRFNAKRLIVYEVSLPTTSGFKMPIGTKTAGKNAASENLGHSRWRGDCFEGVSCMQGKAR